MNLATRLRIELRAVKGEWLFLEEAASLLGVPTTEILEAVKNNDENVEFKDGVVFVTPSNENALMSLAIGTVMFIGIAVLPFTIG